MRSRGKLRAFAAVLGLLYILLLDSAFVTSAPVTVEELEYKHEADGCYYMLELYKNGEQIRTNEPCLNCTCTNSMLMCYLKTCPFSKPVGSECSVERINGQCCPIIKCPEVPVMIPETGHMASELPAKPGTTQGSSLASTTTELATLEADQGCYVDNEFFMEGSQVPLTRNDPCDLCYCIRNHTACVQQQCTLYIPGCTPKFKEGICCPVGYDCDNSVSHTTAVTTTTTTTTTTTLPPTGCYIDDDYHFDGSAIHTGRPCDHCYCMQGKVVCAVQECDPEIKGCEPIYETDQCCPSRYECPHTEQPTTLMSIAVDMTTINPEDDQSTTLFVSNDLHNSSHSKEPLQPSPSDLVPDSLLIESATEVPKEQPIETDQKQPVKNVTDSLFIESTTELPKEMPSDGTEKQPVKHVTGMPFEEDAVNQDETTEYPTEKETEQSVKDSTTILVTTAKPIKELMEQPVNNSTTKPVSTEISDPKLATMNPQSMSEAPIDKNIINDTLTEDNTENEVPDDGNIYPAAEQRTDGPGTDESTHKGIADESTEKILAVEHTIKPETDKTTMTAQDGGLNSPLAPAVTDKSESEESTNKFTQEQSSDKPAEDTTFKKPGFGDITVETIEIASEHSSSEKEIVDESTKVPEFVESTLKPNDNENTKKPEDAMLKEDTTEEEVVKDKNSTVISIHDLKPTDETLKMEDLTTLKPQGDDQQDVIEAIEHDKDFLSTSSTGDQSLTSQPQYPENTTKDSNLISSNLLDETIASAQITTPKAFPILLEPTALPFDESSEITENQKPAQTNTSKKQPNNVGIVTKDQPTPHAIFESTEPSSYYTEDFQAKFSPEVKETTSEAPILEETTLPNVFEDAGLIKAAATSAKPTFKPVITSTLGIQEETTPALVKSVTSVNAEDTTVDQDLADASTIPSDDTNVIDVSSGQGQSPLGSPSNIAGESDDSTKIRDLVTTIRALNEEVSVQDELPHSTEIPDNIKNESENSSTQAPLESIEVLPTLSPSTKETALELAPPSTENESTPVKESDKKEITFAPNEIQVEADVTTAISDVAQGDYSSTVIQEQEKKSATDSNLAITTLHIDIQTTSNKPYTNPPTNILSILDGIPGEGDCHLNGVTFENGQLVPSKDICQSNCSCHNSIIKCDKTFCTMPDVIKNMSCHELFEDGRCCPRYVCDHTAQGQGSLEIGSLVTIQPTEEPSLPQEINKVTTAEIVQSEKQDTNVTLIEATTELAKINNGQNQDAKTTPGSILRESETRTNEPLSFEDQQSTEIGHAINESYKPLPGHDISKPFSDILDKENQQTTLPSIPSVEIVKNESKTLSETTTKKSIEFESAVVPHNETSSSTDSPKETEYLTEPPKAESGTEKSPSNDILGSFNISTTSIKPGNATDSNENPLKLSGSTSQPVEVDGTIKPFEDTKAAAEASNDQFESSFKPPKDSDMTEQSPINQHITIKPIAEFESTTKVSIDIDQSDDKQVAHIITDTVKITTPSSIEGDGGLTTSISHDLASDTKYPLAEGNVDKIEIMQPNNLEKSTTEQPIVDSSTEVHVTSVPEKVPPPTVDYALMQPKENITELPSVTEKPVLSTITSINVSSTIGSSLHPASAPSRQPPLLPATGSHVDEIGYAGPEDDKAQISTTPKIIIDEAHKATTHLSIDIHVSQSENRTESPIDDVYLEATDISIHQTESPASVNDLDENIIHTTEQPSTSIGITKLPTQQPTSSKTTRPFQDVSTTLHPGTEPTRLISVTSTKPALISISEIEETHKEQHSSTPIVDKHLPTSLPHLEPVLELTTAASQNVEIDGLNELPTSSKPIDVAFTEFVSTTTKFNENTTPIHQAVTAANIHNIYTTEFTPQTSIADEHAVTQVTPKDQFSQEINRTITDKNASVSDDHIQTSKPPHHESVATTVHPGLLAVDVVHTEKSTQKPMVQTEEHVHAVTSEEQTEESHNTKMPSLQESATLASAPVVDIGHHTHIPDSPSTHSPPLDFDIHLQTTKQSTLIVMTTKPEVDTHHSEKPAVQEHIDEVQTELTSEPSKTTVLPAKTTVTTIVTQHGLETNNATSSTKTPILYPTSAITTPLPERSTTVTLPIQTSSHHTTTFDPTFQMVTSPPVTHVPSTSTSSSIPKHHLPHTSTAAAAVHKESETVALSPDHHIPEEEYGEESYPEFGIPIPPGNFTLEEGECIYESRIYQSAQQIPRDDPCDFCFCFRMDIICLQQSCPPPIEGCHEESIPGFCCPRYECPVTAVALNVSDAKVPYPVGSNRYRTVRALTQVQLLVCEFRNRFYNKGELIPAASGPCMDCICGERGAMKCIPKKCQLSPFWQTLPGFKKLQEKAGHRGRGSRRHL